MATFMAAVESTIVATAMPTIVAELGGFSLFSWVFAVYLLTQAVSIPVYGRLADIYGRKKVFYAGAGLFLIGSTLCGFAPNMVWLVLFRALQGFGAGGVQPIAMTICGDIYTPSERARVQGLISSVFGVAAVAGPSLGAFLVEHVGWRTVFWVNLPVGAVAMLMISLFLHERIEPRAHRVDYLGSLLMMLGIAALMLVLVQGSTLPSGIAWAAAAAGLFGLAALVVHEARTLEPMLPLELWRDRVIVIGSLGGGLAGAIMMGVSAFLPTYVQGALGRSPLTAGLVLGCMSVTWAFASIFGGRFMVRTTYRLTATLGALSLLAGQRRAGAADAGARRGVGERRVAGDGRRHGAVQHGVHRFHPGGGAVGEARRRDIFLSVPAIYWPGAGGGLVRRGPERHHPSSCTGVGAAGEPAVGTDVPRDAGRGDAGAVDRPRFGGVA